MKGWAMQRFHWAVHFKEGWTIFWQSLLGKLGVILLGFFALMALASFLPPMIDPMYHPMTGVDPDIPSSIGPTLKHWLGTDFMGRDILSQLLAGARVAFMVGVSAAFMSIFLGTAIGMVAGYTGKMVDTLLMRTADMVMVMPTLLVVLILASLFGQTEYLEHCAHHRPVSMAGRIQGHTGPDPFPEAQTLHRGGEGGRGFPSPDHIPPYHAQRAALGFSLHDLSGYVRHHHRGGPGLPGIRGPGHGELGHDASMGLEDGPHVPGPLLASPARHLHLSHHALLLYVGSGHG